MSFFGGLKNSIANKFSDIAEKRKEDKEFEERLRREQRILERLEYEKAYRESARKAAIIKAQRDAGKKTGLAKLRAIKRAETLKEGKQPVFPRLATYMQANMQRREENLRKTELLRKESDSMKGLNKVDTKQRYKPFSDLNRSALRY